MNFDGSDCIAEKMLEIDYFASAFIGNTRYGWFNEGQTEGPSLHLHREFVSALYGKKINTLGAAHLESRIQSAPFVTAPDQWEPGALRWCFYGCNVLGDAAMAAWTDRINQFQDISYYSEFSDIFKVETHVPAAKVSLSSDSVLITTTIADSGGTATFQLDSTFANQSLKLTIIALNYKPYTEIINFVPNPSAVNIDPINSNLKFELKAAYPNPFNPITTIEFSITKTSHVNLTIFNIKGQKVRTITDGELPAGIHRLNWDGRDNSGNLLANGVYLYKLISDEGVQVKSCVLLK